MADKTPFDKAYDRFFRQAPPYVRWLYLVVPALLGVMFMLPEEFWSGVPGAQAVNRMFSMPSSSSGEALPWGQQAPPDADAMGGSLGVKRMPGGDAGSLPDGVAGGGMQYGGEETDGLAPEDRAKADGRGLAMDPEMKRAFLEKMAKMKEGKKDKKGFGAAGGKGETAKMDKLRALESQSGTGSRWSGTPGGGGPGSTKLSRAGEGLPAGTRGPVTAAATRSLGAFAQGRGETSVSRFGEGGAGLQDGAGRRSNAIGYNPGEANGVAGSTTEGVGGGSGGSDGSGLGTGGAPGITGSNNGSGEMGLVGGKIEAPEVGEGRQATGEEVQGTDECTEVRSNCEKVYADFDAQLATLEGDLQKCYTMVSTKDGTQKVVDQACFDRVNAKLQEKRAERAAAVGECQEAGQTCTPK